MSDNYKRKWSEDMEEDSQSEGSFTSDTDGVDPLEEKLDLLLEKFEQLEALLKQSLLSKSSPPKLSH